MGALSKFLICLGLRDYACALDLEPKLDPQDAEATREYVDGLPSFVAQRRAWPRPEPFRSGSSSPPSRLLAPAKRYIHIFPQTLKESIEKGTNVPVIAVRPADAPEQYALYHGVEILGPCRLFREKTALPDTGGRGVAYIITEAPIRAYGEGTR